MNESVPSWVSLKRLEGETTKDTECRKLCKVKVSWSTICSAKMHGKSVWNQVMTPRYDTFSSHIGQYWFSAKWKELRVHLSKNYKVDSFLKRQRLFPRCFGILLKLKYYYTTFISKKAIRPETLQHRLWHLHWDCCQFQNFIPKCCLSILSHTMHSTVKPILTHLF